MGVFLLALVLMPLCVPLRHFVHFGVSSRRDAVSTSLSTGKIVHGRRDLHPEVIA
jgi:hypothetical protein